jgi:hypothetical protein
MIMNSGDLIGGGRGLFEGTTPPGEPEKIHKHYKDHLWPIRDSQKTPPQLYRLLCLRNGQQGCGRSLLQSAIPAVNHRSLRTNGLRDYNRTRNFQR